MSDLKRKLAEKIARDLFTSGERRYSHLSLNDAEELGWCEKAVADRIEERLLAAMDDFKVGDWFKCRTNFCHGGQVAKIDDDYIVDQEGEYHLATDAYHVPAPKSHEFKAGDWAQHDNHAAFKVRSTYPKGDDRYIYGEDGQAWLASSLRNVPAPEPAEASPESEKDIFVPMQPKSERKVTMRVPRHEPFQGPHWNADAISQASVDDESWSAYLRDCDLCEELRRMREGKRERQ